MRLLLAWLLLAWLLLATPLAAPLAAAIDDARVRQILESRGHRFPATAVGIVDERGARVVAFGRVPVDGDSLFELGSVTKVFTGMLLAGMAARGEVSLDDPVEKYLPEGIHIATPSGKPVTLLSLATHTSGLPRLPPNLKPADPANPYAAYTVDQLYAALAQLKLTRDPFATYEYSNFGMGLLGHALARRAGTTYFALLRERILAPLGMNDTVITPTPAQGARMVPGHLATGAPASNWDMPVLEGAGALRSTANDMVKLLEAMLGKRPAPAALLQAMARSADPMLPAGDGLRVGLAWHTLDRRGLRIDWHNGGTGGYRAWLGFLPETRTGIVVLTNTALSPDDLGLHLLHRGFPLVDYRPNSARRELMQEQEALAEHVGRYQLSSGVVLEIAHVDGRLQLRAREQRVRLHAESPTRYFARDAEIQLEFGPDGLLLRTEAGVMAAQKLP